MPPSNHARLSASSAHRWLECPPSVAATEHRPDETSIFAEEGSAAHEAAEYKVLWYLGERDMKPPSTGQFDADEIDKHTDTYAFYAADKIEEIRKSCPDAIVLVEQRLDFSNYVEDGFGTGDLVIVADDVIHVILASYAQEESLSVSENCKWRIRNDFKQGIPTGTTVYGYFAKNRQFTINETKAAIVRRIFEMYISGIGSNCIADALNKDNIPSPGGGVWVHRAVMDILKNEKYIGDLMLQKYYTVDHISKKTKLNDGRLDRYYVSDHHDPIIKREIFEQVQKMIEDREKKAPHVKPYEYDFKHMVFCENCGCKYYRKKVHTNTQYERFVWKCKTYSYKGKKYCDNKQIPDDVLIRFTEGFDKEIVKIVICKNNLVKLMFSDGTEAERSWEIDRKWTDEMKARNYENLRRRYL